MAGRVRSRGVRQRIAGSQGVSARRGRFLRTAGLCMMASRRVAALGTSLVAIEGFRRVFPQRREQRVNDCHLTADHVVVFTAVGTERSRYEAGKVRNEVCVGVRRIQTASLGQDPLQCREAPLAIPSLMICS